MGANRYYRRYIEKMIAANPAEIIITRKVRTDDGYGGEFEQNVTLTPQIVTFYDRKSLREVVSDAGKVTGSHLERSTKLLAAGGADIRVGDVFTHEGKTYRISFRKAYLDICIQAEVEVVS